MCKDLTLQDQFLLDLFQHCQLIRVLQHLKGESVSDPPIPATSSLQHLTELSQQHKFTVILLSSKSLYLQTHAL